MENDSRISNFYRCPYGSKQNSWEIEGDNKKFKVVYKCIRGGGNKECLEFSLSKERCDILDTI